MECIALITSSWNNHAHHLQVACYRPTHQMIWFPQMFGQKNERLQRTRPNLEKTGLEIA